MIILCSEFCRLSSYWLGLVCSRKITLSSYIITKIEFYMILNPPGNVPLEEHFADSPRPHPHDGSDLLLPQPRSEQGVVMCLQHPQGCGHYHMGTCHAPFHPGWVESLLSFNLPCVGGYYDLLLLGQVDVLHPGVEADDVLVLDVVHYDIDDAA